MDSVLELGIEFNRNLETFRTPLLTVLFEVFAFLGSAKGYALMIPLIFWLKSAKLGLRLVLGVLFCDFINTVLKLSFQLERPFMVDSTLIPLDRPETLSFPSGHSQQVAFFWTFLYIQTRSKFVLLLAPIFILFTGLSRNYLGVHYFFDVLVGWFIGFLFAFLLSRHFDVLESFRKHFESFTKIALFLLASLLVIHLFPAKHLAITLGGTFGLLLGPVKNYDCVEKFENARVGVLFTLLGYLGIFLVAGLGGFVGTSIVGTFFTFAVLTFWMAFGLPQIVLRFNRAN